jgi:hypothetical protein
MKRTTLFLVILFAVGFVAQAQENPFKKYGVKGDILTLSKGKYKETFYNEDVMQVGTVRINIWTEKIVEFLEPDTTEFAYRAEVTSRFISVDPLCEEHYNWSPYAYALNNPIRFIDPDGRLERDPNGNVKFYASGQIVSREMVRHNGFELTPNYNSGYVMTDKGNKVSAEQLVSVSVVSADGRTQTFSADQLGKIGDFDFTSNCFGLAMADGQVFINEPETILADEYTQVGQEKGANMDNVGNTKHDIVTVGSDGLGTTNHAATSNGKGTYTHKDNNTKVRTNEPINRVVDLFGKGTVGGVDVPDLDIHLYKKN